eukprot:gene8613-11646_t
MLDNLVDAEGDGSGYSGTFRWKASKLLQSIPLMNTSNLPKLNYGRGWMEYFISRSNNNNKRYNNNVILTNNKGDDIEIDDSVMKIIQFVQSDLSIIDCLSSPVTICALCEQIKFSFLTDLIIPTINSNITIICIGCAAKTEERILKETSAWLELFHFFAYYHINISLWLVGPEISSSESNLKFHLYSYNLFKGTAMSFFRQNSHLLNHSTMIIGLNCGFGNFDNPLPIKYNLLLQWLPDLYFLTGTQLPLLFTCANDYSDLTGEVTIMRDLLGANFISIPSENKFSYASTMIPPTDNDNNDHSNEYSRGNSYCYAVQSHSKARRKKIDFKNFSEKQIIQIVVEIVKHSKSSQFGNIFDVSNCLVKGKLTPTLPNNIINDTKKSSVENVKGTDAVLDSKQIVKTGQLDSVKSIDHNDNNYSTNNYTVNSYNNNDNSNNNNTVSDKYEKAIEATIIPRSPQDISVHPLSMVSNGTVNQSMSIYFPLNINSLFEFLIDTSILSHDSLNFSLSYSKTFLSTIPSNYILPSIRDAVSILISENGEQLKLSFIGHLMQSYDMLDNSDQEMEKIIYASYSLKPLIIAIPKDKALMNQNFSNKYNQYNYCEYLIPIDSAIISSTLIIKYTKKSNQLKLTANKQR